MARVAFCRSICKGTFAFEVLLGGDLHFAQGLRVRLHVEVQHGFTLYLYGIYRHVFVADVTDGEGIGPVFQLQCIVTIQIGDGALCRSAHLHGGSRQRFFGLSVGDCPFDGSCRGSHDGKCEE